jgi:long-chain acyl-CoA synthetase
MPNYYHRFLQSVEKWPAQVAVELLHPSRPTESYTYSELRHNSDAVAAWLSATELPRGSRCIIMAANGPRWVATFMGTLGAGMIAVPLDTAFSSEQVRKLLVDSGSVLAFADEKHLETVLMAVKAAGVEGQFATVLIDGVAEGAKTTFDAILKSATAATFAPVTTDPNETAAILYSSGTTGDPKGVMLTHENFVAETTSILRAFQLGPEDSILGILPLFHALALAIDLLLPLASGSKVVFLESLNTADLVKTLPTTNVFICVPQFFYLIHERIWKEVSAKGKFAEKAFRTMLAISGFARRFGINLGKVFFGKIHHLIGPKMRYLGSGGSKLDPAIGHEFEAMGFVMLQGYGLTETTGCAMYTPPERMDIGTIGEPLPGTEVKILNPETLPGDTHPTGEIAIRGPIVMKGYWNRPDATAAVLDSEGWLHSGDLGYVDSRGFVKITGRAKEIIVLSNGKNIYPDEIEAHYLKTPFIKEMCVVGLQSKPGEPYSERLHAVIVPNFDVLKQNKIVNTREVLRYEIENLSTKVPSTKRILSYEIWQEELPRTTTRKIKRFEVEKRVIENEARGQAAETGEVAQTKKVSDDDRKWLETPEVQRAMGVIRAASKTKKEDIHPNDNLELDLGLDSMERVELLVAVERELGATLDDSVASTIYTVRELVEAARFASGPGLAVTERPTWEAVLQEESNDPDVLNVIKPHPISTRFWFTLTRFAAMIMRDRFQMRVEGIEKLPAKGPFIICPNHQSFLDPPGVMSSLPWNVYKDVFYVGTSDLFGAGLWRHIARSLNLIPVDPDANLIPAMRAGAFGLRHGKTLVLYPEGERSIDGIPKTFKKGAAILATHLNVPIVPVALDGFYEAWPRNQKFQKFSRLRIRFGDPIYPSANPRNPEAAYDAITRELRNRVVEMWEEIHEELYPKKSGDLVIR